MGRNGIAAGLLGLALVGWTWAGAPSVRFEVEEGANRARYMVTEQLFGRDFPNDAVGETGAVTGALVLDDEGRPVADESVIRIDMASLATDSERRDGYVRRRVLLTDEHPVTALRVTGLEGLPWPIPETGSVELRLRGDLTVVGVTRPTTWTAEATFLPGRVTGTARTAFAFTDFGMEKPRVRSVLSVADTIRLEYDFSFARR